MQSTGLKQKSTYELWQQWAKVVKRQFDLAAEVYAEHKQDAGGKKAREFAARVGLFIDPVAHAAELAKQNFDVKGSVTKLYLLSLTNLHGLFREAIKLMPQLSEDMQQLLNSPCYGNCRGRVASDIFKGPHGTNNEGIAAGVVDERGGLPWVLNKLLDDAELYGEEYFHRGLDGGGDSEEGGGDASSSTPRTLPQQQRRKITATGVQ